MEKSLNYSLNPQRVKHFLDKNPFAKLKDIVFEILEEAIITHSLKVGDKINVSQIAKMLNISRTPVKEALNALVDIGFVVTSEDKTGYYVFNITRRHMDELLAVRAMLEGEAAYLCAKQSYRLKLDDGMALAKSFCDAYYQKDFTAFTSLDATFHKWVVSNCGNNMLIGLYNSIERDLHYNTVRNKVTLNRALSLTNSFNSFEVMAHQHIFICNAIAQGFAQVSMNLMREHLDLVWTTFYAILPPESDDGRKATGRT